MGVGGAFIFITKTMFDLKFTAKVESLQEDVDDRLNVVKSKIPKALQSVGAEMIANLRMHLEEDWYKQYTPEAYERRTDNPSLGTAITDTKVMIPTISGLHFEFDYEPTGSYGKTLDLPTRYGDKLIEWLQNDQYVRGVEIPGRPFWNNFVKDQEKSAVESFLSALKSPSNYTLVSDENDLLDLTEYLLSENGSGTGGGTQLNFDNFTDGDDELPY